MKEIKLTKGYVALVDDIDYAWLIKFKWQATESTNTYYARTAITVNGRQKYFAMHRMIMGVVSADTKVDHNDHDGLNNQRNNLRVCTHSENTRNKKKGWGVSKFKGVIWHKATNKWLAQIGFNYKQKYLGIFDNEVDAAIAYNKAAVELHGEFASLNQFVT